MKILSIESSPNWGGQEERLVREAQWLERHDHRVIIVCRSDSALFARANAVGLRVETLPLKTHSNPAALAKLLVLIWREKVDVLHTHSSKDAWTCFWLHLLGVPVVRSRHISLGTRFGKGRAFIYRHGCRKLIASAQWIQQQFVDKGEIPADRVQIIGEGVDLIEFNPERNGSAFRESFGIPKDAPLFGVVGMLRGEKGQQYFMSAAIRVAAEHPEARFVIVGKSTGQEAMEEYLRKEIKKAFGGAREPAVIMTGFRKDVPEVMAALDVLVVPSTMDAQTLVIPQAFATGRPVIGSNVGGIPELVRHEWNGLLVEPRDVEAIAAAMKRMIVDAGLRRECAHNALEFARKELSFDAKMNALLGCYEGALRGKK